MIATTSRAGVAAPCGVAAPGGAVRLLAGGQHLRPLCVADGRLLFAPPAGADEVVIASDTMRPSDARPWLDDRRRLGVQLRRLRLLAGNEVRDIALDGPHLAAGWHGVEREGGGLARGTAGMGRFTAGGIRGAAYDKADAGRCWRRPNRRACRKRPRAGPRGVAPTMPPSPPAPDAAGALIADLGGQRFGCILADPPWRFVNRTGKVAPEHRRLARYGTMTNETIAALPAAELAAATAHLYLWVPNALLPEGLRVMAAWGFEYKSNLAWRKIRADGGSDGRGVGFYFRNVTELVLFGVRGRRARTLAPGRSQVNYLQTRRREHSRKPDELYPTIEACSPGPRLELFARVARPGWTVWGDQATDRYAGKHGQDAALDPSEAPAPHLFAI